LKRYFTTLITWTLCATTALAADAIWTELPPLPMNIANNAVTSRDNGDGTCTLYSFMGIELPTNRNTITAASFKMTTPGGTWTAIADAPLLNGLAKIAANAITVAGEVYLIGGYTAGGPEVTEHRLFRYDPTADTYIQLADVPVEVDDTVVGVYQGRYIYLISGWHGPVNNNVKNVQVYDTSNNTWQQATQIPAPSTGLFGHAGTIIGDRIIYIDGTKVQGGFRISDTVAVGRIDPFNNGSITTVAWTVVDPHPGLPTYRAAATLGPTADGLMLVTGGTDNPYNFNGTGYNGQPSFPLDQILTYDPLTDT
jgi:N-acetylneuraminic acid mutarotase